MRKRAVLPALMTALLLCGCGGSGAAAERRLEEQRETLAPAEIRFTADVTANLGAEVFQCTLACAGTPEKTEIEVLAPEKIAGIRAAASEGETALEYAGVSLTLGGMEERLSPVGAAPLLFRALREGHIIRAWREQDLLAAELYADDDYALTVWFSSESLAPVHASVGLDGTELLRCDIRDFTYQ